MGMRGEKETTATCSRKMSVRANRSVASSISSFVCSKAVSFCFWRGTSKKRTRNETEMVVACRLTKKQNTKRNMSKDKGETARRDLLVFIFLGLNWGGKLLGRKKGFSLV